MKFNQEILRSQVEKYSEQMRRLAQSDNLVRQLAAENETLVMALQTLEESISHDDRLSNDDNSSVSRDCLEFLHDTLSSSNNSSGSGTSSCSSDD